MYVQAIHSFNTAYQSAFDVSLLSCPSPLELNYIDFLALSLLSMFDEILLLRPTVSKYWRFYLFSAINYLILILKITVASKGYLLLWRC